MVADRFGRRSSKLERVASMRKHKKIKVLCVCRGDIMSFVGVRTGALQDQQDSLRRQIRDPADRFSVEPYPVHTLVQIFA